MKIRIHNIKWDTLLSENLVKLPKEKVKEITQNDFHNYGLEEEDFPRLSIGELNLIGVDMFKELYEEYKIHPIDGSFEFHWGFSEFGY